MSTYVHGGYSNYSQTKTDSWEVRNKWMIMHIQDLKRSITCIIFLNSKGQNQVSILIMQVQSKVHSASGSSQWHISSLINHKWNDCIDDLISLVDSPIWHNSLLTQGPNNAGTSAIQHKYQRDHHYINRQIQVPHSTKTSNEWAGMSRYDNHSIWILPILLQQDIWDWSGNEAGFWQKQEATKRKFIVKSAE